MNWRCHCGVTNHLSDHCQSCSRPRHEGAEIVGKKAASNMLRSAADLIEQRGAQRDRPGGEKTMAATINAFNAIYGTSLTEVQGWHLMELLKMVRSAYGVYVEDDYLDKIAYAALAGEAAQ